MIDSPHPELIALYNVLFPRGPGEFAPNSRCYEEPISSSELKQLYEEINCSVEVLPIKSRTIRTLKRYGIYQFKELQQLTKRELKKIPGLGLKGVEEILNHRKLK